MGPNWNTAPRQKALVVRRYPETGERHLDALKWGVLPSWTKDPAHAERPINGRSETMTQLPSFRRGVYETPGDRADPDVL
jgi:putative SOS response-associated peptidase YedK